MRSYKSFIAANKVLEGLENNVKLNECLYHPFYSGGTEPNGACGYVLCMEHKHKTIKVVFYGTNKETDTPVHIFVLIDDKSRIRDKQFNIKDATEFIENKIIAFLEKSKN